MSEFRYLPAKNEYLYVSHAHKKALRKKGRGSLPGRLGFGAHGAWGAGGWRRQKYQNWDLKAKYPCYAITVQFKNPDKDILVQCSNEDDSEQFQTSP